MNFIPPNRAFGQTLRNSGNHRQIPVRCKRKNKGLPGCLKQHDNASEILNSMTQVIDEFSYLPQDIIQEFRQKHRLSAEEVKKVYFHILKRKREDIKSEESHYRARSYNDVPEMHRDASAMSISEVSENAEFYSDASAKKLAEIFQRQNLSWEHASQVYANLQSSQHQHSIEGSDVLAKSPELNFSMRTILIDWLHEVVLEYNLEWQTLLLCIQIIDRFLTISTVRKTNLQLVGVTALWIASKMEEIHPPAVSDFTYISDDAYTYQEILKFEERILKKLEWRITIPTVYDFLSHLFIFYQNEQIQENTQMFVDIFLQHKEYTYFQTSHIASAAILLATLYSEDYHWTEEITRFTQEKPENLLQCCRKINQAYGQSLNRTKARSAYMKHYREHKKIIYPHRKWAYIRPAY